jgi:hypothetical protein
MDGTIEPPLIAATPREEEMSETVDKDAEAHIEYVILKHELDWIMRGVQSVAAKHRDEMERLMEMLTTASKRLEVLREMVGMEEFVWAPVVVPPEPEPVASPRRTRGAKVA